ncbi:helix-turn-helix domain-containing protein [Tumebacillus flagellatus]|uniref:HTH cro/C1-type domain-containing protein n=1 Tax=Tumebacillus flagellatus TaxID=1157490 RepID=A0A074LKM5_9BACL|nr:helix-turn-helix transcriptional regulator [Tumebacillus flagellatus]KEO81644.1 hypothetical protein EL26_19420 [Tumebacillus flagellatus]
MENRILNNGGFVDTMSDGRRLKEILEERAESDKHAWSVAAFAIRVPSISESTLYRIVNEQRPMKPQEKRAIVQALNISIERFDMKDVEKTLLGIQAQVEFNVNLQAALSAAQKIMPLALGFTEKFVLLNNFGAIHYREKNYILAIATWSDALTLAEKIYSLFGECEPLYMAVSNLTLAYAEVNDFYNVAKLLSSIESRFNNLPARFSAAVAYSLAINAKRLGDEETYEAKMYEQYDFYQQVGGERVLAVALHNVAYMLYSIGKLMESVEKFEELYSFLTEHPTVRKSEYGFIMLKDYAKALVRAGRKQEGIQLIHRLLNEVEGRLFHKVKGKLMLLDAIYSKNSERAKEVLELKEALTEHKLMAIQILMKESAKANDAESLMRYYEIGDAIQPSSDSEMEAKL